MPKAIAALALLFCSTGAFAQVDGYSKLSGDLTITSENGDDPPPGAVKDRVGFVLYGASAKQVYDAMKVKPALNICEDGMRIKTAGALECSRDERDNYTCMFAIMLANGRSRPFGSC